MFEQPPSTNREVFSRGFINGLASALIGPIFSIAALSWKDLKYWDSVAHAIHAIALSSLILGTIFCAVAAYPRDEKQIGLFRGGVLTAYLLFIALIAAIWFVRL